MKLLSSILRKYYKVKMCSCARGVINNLDERSLYCTVGYLYSFVLLVLASFMVESSHKQHGADPQHWVK
jgi:hypothetical protein